MVEELLFICFECRKESKIFGKVIHEIFPNLRCLQATSSEVKDLKNEKPGYEGI
ncbi:hypothetical protein RV10_GL001124 [Enterococcus pallens]|nr:hypothetical protein RV10_GL001124 [Enterococcus pallens]